jgi:type II secretory pathway pseudopilin PulG
MKYCPTCNTRYDEEVLRFCMKDGTPLVEEDEPSFIEMPSESVEEPEDDEPGEVTVIRKSSAPLPPPPQSLIDEISFSPDAPDEGPSRGRIVVPTADEQPEMQPPRARVIPPYQPVPQPPNTAKVVVLTIIGTIAAMTLGALGFWFLQSDRGAENLNVNTNFNAYLENSNTNVNTNLGIDSNFNFNINGNFNAPTNINANFNANVRTPTPTPTPRPSPSATATPDDGGTPTPSPTRPPGASPTPIIIRPGQTPPRMAPLPTNRPPANN